MKKAPKPGWGIIGTTILLGLLLTVRAQAYTYTVTDTNDTTAVTSLRGAIIAANQRGGENTIILGEEPRKHQQPQTWIFYLTIQGINEYAAQTGDLDVTSGRLTITGAVAGVTIDATALGDRGVSMFIRAQELDLENVAINGVRASRIRKAPGGDGGGIIITLGDGITGTSIGGIGGGGGGGVSGTPIVFQANALIRNAGTSSTIPALTNGGGGILNNGAMTMRNCLLGSRAIRPCRMTWRRRDFEHPGL